MSKNDILFFPQCIVISNHRKVLYKIGVLDLWSKTLKKIRFKDIYILILVFPIFETNQGVAIFKKPQEELINWYLPFATPIHHRSVMLMRYVIQSGNKKNRVRSRIDAKNRVSVVCIIFSGNVSWKKVEF